MNNETDSATATPTGSIVAKTPAFSTLSKDNQCKHCNRGGANICKPNLGWFHAACLTAGSTVPPAKPITKAGEAALGRLKLVEAVVSETHAKVSETPVKVSKAPAEVSKATAEVSEAPVKVSEALVKVSKATAEVSKAPAEVSEAPAKVSETPVKVSKATAEVSKATAEVSESAKIVVVSDGEEDTRAPGCPILAITIQDEKAVDQLEVITKDFKEYLQSLPADQRYTCIEAASAHVGKLEDECNIMKGNLPTAEEYNAKEANIRAQMGKNLFHQGEIAQQIRLSNEKREEWKNAQKIAWDNKDKSKDDELDNIATSLKAELDQFPKDLEKQRDNAIAQGNDLNEQLKTHRKYNMAVLKQNLDAWTTFVDGLRIMLMGVEADAGSWDGGSHDSGMIFDYNANQRFTADQIKNFRDCLRHHLEHTLTDERIEEVVQKNYHDVPASLLQTIKSMYDPAMHFGQQNRALFFKGVIDNGQPYEGFNPWTVCADEEVLAGAARTVAERVEHSEDEETERSESEEEDELSESEEEDEPSKNEEEDKPSEDEDSNPTEADIFGEACSDDEKPAPAPVKRVSPALKAAEIQRAAKEAEEAAKAQAAEAKAQATKAKAEKAEAEKAAKAQAAEAKAQAAKAKAEEAEAAKAAKAQAAEAVKAAKAQAAEAAKAAKAQAAKAEKDAAAKLAKAAKPKSPLPKAAAKAAVTSDNEEDDSDVEVRAKPIKRARESTDAKEEGEKLMAQAAKTMRNLDSKDIQAARKEAGRINPPRSCSTPTSNMHFYLSGKCGAWNSVTSATQGKSSGDTIERVMEEILCKSKNGQQSCCGGKFIANKNTTVVIVCNSVRLSQNNNSYEANVQAIETYAKEGTEPVYFVAYVYNGRACYNMVYAPQDEPAPKKSKKGK